MYAQSMLNKHSHAVKKQKKSKSKQRDFNSSVDTVTGDEHSNIQPSAFKSVFRQKPSESKCQKNLNTTLQKKVLSQNSGTVPLKNRVSSPGNQMGLLSKSFMPNQTNRYSASSPLSQTRAQRMATSHERNSPGNQIDLDRPTIVTSPQTYNHSAQKSYQTIQIQNKRSSLTQ